MTAGDVIGTMVLVLVVVVAVLVATVVGLNGVGRLRTRLRTPEPARGDPLLARVIDASGDRKVRRLAAVVVDGPAGQIRSCFLGADADTRWEIGSVSKALTGLLVADAIERGELTLDTTLRQLDPQYAASVAGAATVRELATHTSGLPPILTNPFATLGFSVFGLDPYRSTSPTLVARGARRRRRLRSRGRYRYSNLGASVLGNALARRAGVDYAGLLRARLTAPLAMAATTAQRDIGPELPRGWRPGGRRSHPWRMPGYLPAGVVSTAADMTTLMVALLDGSAPGLAALSPQDGAFVGGRPLSRQAMFWIVDTDQASGRRKIWHTGQTGGSSAYLALFPDADRAVVVMLDLADAARAERISDLLIRTVVDDAALQR